MARKYQLHGTFPSKAGDSAYEVALKNGFEGTEQEWLASLKGKDAILPIATPDTLGGVKPVAKSEDMTQPVGVDELGGLWSALGSGINVNSAIPGQTIVVKEVDETGKPTQWEAADLPDGIKTSFTTLWTGSLSEGYVRANSSAQDYDLVFVTFYQNVSGRAHIFDVSFQPKQLRMAGSDYGVLLPLCLIDGTPKEQMLRIFTDYKTFTLIDTAKPYTMTKITGVKFNA